MSERTIFARSSGPGPSAVAVIRVSGPGAAMAAEALAGRCPQPQRAVVRTIVHPDSGEALDKAVLLFFPGPKSATGEDILEIHTHGGRAVVEAVEGALAALPGMAPARPGEFTWRAFENGKIDLLEVEGLGDLLHAETEAQRRNALAIAGGGLSAQINDWQRQILVIGALIESRLDFSDEGDVATLDVDPQARAMIASLEAELAMMLGRPPAEPLRDGVHVVIAGPPNAGKSTLLNRLVERDAAIVSDIAGTTRDLVEVPAVIAGTAYRFTDTAGLREASEDPIERIGMDRATRAMAAADILLWLGDPPPPRTGPNVLHIHARADQPGRQAAPPEVDLVVSAKTGTGIEALVDRIGEIARLLLPRADETLLNRRQREAIEAVAGHLRAADSTSDDLIRGEHMRLARARFDALTGRAGTEEMLDTLFGAFCIGK
jgi:tRNA modification GTPase